MLVQEPRAQADPADHPAQRHFRQRYLAVPCRGKIDDQRAAVVSEHGTATEFDTLPRNCLPHGRVPCREIVLPAPGYTWNEGNYSGDHEPCGDFVFTAGARGAGTPTHDFQKERIMSEPFALTEAMIHDLAEPEVFARGRSYLRQGAVTNLARSEDRISAQVQGMAEGKAASAMLSVQTELENTFPEARRCTLTSRVIQ